MKIKFFAWLKEDIQDEIELNVDSISIAELKEELIKKLGDKCQILKDPSILSSVNLEFADDNTMLNNNDEVAFFPPVTGG